MRPSKTSPRDECPEKEGGWRQGRGGAHHILWTSLTMSSWYGQKRASGSLGKSSTILDSLCQILHSLPPPRQTQRRLHRMLAGDNVLSIPSSCAAMNRIPAHPRMEEICSLGTHVYSVTASSYKV